MKTTTYSNGAPRFDQLGRPLLRNGLIDGDAWRSMLKASGPTTLDLLRTAEALAKHRGWSVPV